MPIDDVPPEVPEEKIELMNDDSDDEDIKQLHEYCKRKANISVEITKK